jgi:hypothetical protein
MSTLGRSIVPVIASATMLLAAAPAFAAPPPNDTRAAAQSLAGLPASVRGTTVEATLEPTELASTCGTTKNSVWYGFTADTGRAILIALDADGDLDAVVDVFERQRSQVAPLDCRPTNRRGAATIEIDATRGTSYYVRVGAVENSADARFRLRVVTPDQPASFPGLRLPRKGARAAVDRLSNPDDAWSVRVRRGRTYRINFVSSGGRCARAELYADAGSFRSDPVRRLRCDGYSVFAAPSDATYSVLVFAPRASRDRINYRLRVGRAQADDTAPGIRLANDTGVRGHLQGNQLDAVDLYRFTVGRPSALRLRLRTGRDFDLRLITDTGRRIADDRGFAGTKEIERRIKPGRYYAVIRARRGAAGRYTLRRVVRTITHSRMLVDGGRSATIGPGGAVTLDLAVSPPVSGRAALLIERFDPLAGWLFHSRARRSVSGGHARLHWAPPTIGRWRVSGEFLGTRRAAPSRGGTVHVKVEEPLEP